MDLGFVTKQALKKASEKLLEKPLPGQQFWRECVTFLSTTAKKLLDKCPLNYAAVRHMACLDPVTMISDERRASSLKWCRTIRGKFKGIEVAPVGWKIYWWQSRVHNSV